MKFNNYVDGALRTESTLDGVNIETINNGLVGRILHASMGIATELVELDDAVYQHDVDYVNVAEEIGDMLCKN